jgi:hypothetical protein
MSCDTLPQRLPPTANDDLNTTPPKRSMSALAASALPWPGHQILKQGYLSEHPIQVLLSCANDLVFHA